jgi:hypothetical protein
MSGVDARGGRRCRAMVVAVVAVLVMTLPWVSRAGAHTGGTTGYATIAIEGEIIRYTLTLWPATLPAPAGEELRRARDGETASAERWVGIVRDRVVLTAGGRRCEPRGGALRPGDAADSVTVTLDYACAEPVRALVVRDDVFDALGADHHTLARVDASGRTWQLALAPDMREGRVSLDETGARGFAGFVRLGVEHIVTGWDHLLFLVALLLPGGGVLALVKIVTAFTVAHSVTLSLAVLDVVRLPDRLVEAVIALSIAAVAAEVLFARPLVARRWVVSFAFGLVHGFGFASILRELGLPAGGVALSLLGFNLGVELGQAGFVIVAAPLLAAVRASGYERTLIRGSAVAIVIVGVALFIERAFL